MCDILQGVVSCIDDPAAFQLHVHLAVPLLERAANAGSNVFLLPTWGLLKT